jgi:hypothetical protein
MSALGHQLPLRRIGFSPWKRSRFSTGPKTAVLALLAYRVIGYPLPAIGIGQIGFFPARLIAITQVGGFLEILPATIPGAWLYKE